MKALLAILLAALTLFTSAHADPFLSPADLADGEIIADSTSPNGKLCFIEGFRRGLTSNAIVLASTSRQRVLADAPLTTAYSTDRPHKGRITIVWNPDNQRVAMHDAIAKHSALTMLRAKGDRFAPVTVPDLLEVACRRWRVARADVASSGQCPLRWHNETLTVEVTAKLKSGEPRSVTLELDTSKDVIPAREPKVPPLEIIQSIVGEEQNSEKFKAFLSTYGFRVARKSAPNSWSSSFGVFLELGGGGMTATLFPPVKGDYTSTYPADLPKGLRVGDSTAEILKKLGQPRTAEDHHLIYDGMTIYTDDGKLEKICLFNSGKNPDSPAKPRVRNP